MSLIFLNLFSTLVCFGLFLNASLIGNCILEDKAETYVLLNSSDNPGLKSVGNKSGKWMWYSVLKYGKCFLLFGLKNQLGIIQGPFLNII